MKIDEYQNLAIRTSPCLNSQKPEMLQHALYGLASETGEVLGIFQKVYQGRDVDIEHLKKELGDVLWMVAEACSALDFSMEDVMTTNIEKLEKRFPNKTFDVYSDQHRSEGDV